MAKKYPLTRLLRIRQIREDQASAELALSARRTRQAKARAEHAEREFLGTGLDGEYRASVWNALVAARMAGRSMLLDAETLTQVARAEQEASLQDFQAAHTDVSVLEKLEDKFHARQRLEDDRAEALVLDEIAQSVHRGQEDADER